MLKPVRPGNTKYGNERELLEEELARQEEVEKKTENLEHLQLNPEEIWFLAWGLGCLKVLSPVDVSLLWHSVFAQVPADSLVFVIESTNTPSPSLPSPDIANTELHTSIYLTNTILCPSPT